MLKKHKKWISVITLLSFLLTMLPLNALPAYAASSNATLEAAMQSVTNKNQTTIILSDKNIVGEVDLADIKAHFPNIVRVNLKNNYITKITGEGTPGNPQVVDRTNNLLLANEKALTWAEPDQIERKKYAPEDISLSEYLTKITNATKQLNLQELIDKKIVDKVSFSYTTTTGTLEQSFDVADIANAKVPASAVPDLDPSENIKVKVHYVGQPDGTFEGEVTKEVNVKDISLAVSGLTSPLYTDLSVATVEVKKLDADDNVVAIADVNEVTESFEPALASGTGYEITDKELAPNGTVKMKVKIKQDYDGQMVFTLGAYSKKIPVRAVQANFTEIKLVEKESAAAAGGIEVGATTLGGGEKAGKGVYLLKGTAVSSTDSATFDERQRTLTEGRYYIYVKKPGGDFEPIDASELPIVKTELPAGFEANLIEDGQTAYLSIAPGFDAEGGSGKVIKVSLANQVADVLKLPVVSVQDLKPVGFYIYAFDKDASSALMKQQIKDTVSPYYVKNEALGSQDALKAAAPFELKEGEQKLLLPVAKYEVNGREERRFVPGNILKTWYQRERTQEAFNFTDVAFTKIQANELFKYNVNAEGYPEAGAPEKPYKGAPIEAKVSTSPVGAGLLVKANSLQPNAPTDKFANIVLSMAGTNNPAGFWFQVNWMPKKVKDYVLVEKTYQVPAEMDLDNITPDPGTNKTFKELLEEELAKVDPNKAIITNGELEGNQKLKLPIGLDSTYKVLVIYDNGVVKDFDLGNKLSFAGVGDYEENDLKVTRAADTDTTAAPSVAKISATQNGGIVEKAGKFTDAKSGRKANLMVEGFDQPILEVTLEPSLVTGVNYIIHDELRLLTNADNFKKTGELSKGVWHGELAKIGLGEDDTNPAKVYQGNGSYNKALETKVYLIPRFTNKDLTLKGAGIADLENPDIAIIKKFAWVSDNWAVETDKAVSLAGDNASSEFRGTTNGEPQHMKPVGTTQDVVLTLDGGVSDLNGHKFVEALATDPAAKKKTIPVVVKEPIYDRIGAIAEEIDPANPAQFVKKEIKNNDEDQALDVAIGKPTTVRVKLTNSNLFAMETLGLGGVNFDKGVYFIGNDKVDGSNVLETPANKMPIPETDKQQNTYKDLAILGLASGMESKVPATYATDASGAYDGINRMDFLKQEADKIVAKVYKKKTTGEFVPTDEVEVVPYKNALNANALVPGAYDITALNRGEYYVNFVALHDNVESPLVLTPNPVGGAAVSDDDLKNYDVNKDTYWFKITVNKSPIEKVYNYVTDKDGITIQDDGSVSVDPMSGSTQRIEFDVYPIVVDTALKLAFDKANVPLPDKLDKAGLEAFVQATGKDVKALLADPDSGLSYLDDKSFIDLANAAQNWVDPTTSSITATPEYDSAKKAYKLRVVVQKGEIARNQHNVGFVTADGDLNDLAGPPIVPAKLLKTTPGANFSAAAAHFDIAAINVFQGLGEVLQDIIVDPSATSVGVGNSVKFNVKYKTNKGTEVPLVEDNFLLANLGKPGYLEIKEDPQNPETGLASSVVKVPAADGVAATLTFTPNKIGTYRFYLTTINSENGRVPALMEGQPIEFEVKPFIKDRYNLFYGETQNIEVRVGDTGSVTYAPQTQGLLDVAALEAGSLKIADDWAGLNGTATEEVTVDVMQDGRKIGDFAVTLNPRGAGQYEIVPQTTDADRLKLDDNDTFKLRVRKVYQDNSFEYVAIDRVEFEGGTDEAYAINIPQDKSFINFAAVNEKLYEGTVARNDVTENTKKWQGDWSVYVAGEATPLHFYAFLDNQEVVKDEPSYKIYELLGDTLTDVTGRAADNPAAEIRVQNALTRTLFIVDDSDPANLKVANDYNLAITGEDAMNKRQLLGAAASQIIASTDDLKANPADYARITFTPKAPAVVDFAVSNAENANPVNTGYTFTAGVRLTAQIQGSVDRTVNLNDPVTITALVGGPQNPSLVWEESTDNNTFTAISGETQTSLAVNTSAVGVKYYRLQASVPGDSVTTDVVKVTVLDAPTPPAPPVTGSLAIVGNVTIGQPATLKATLNNVPSSATVAYEWRRKHRTTNQIETLTGNTDTYTTPNVVVEMGNYDYSVKVTVDGQVLNLGPVRLPVSGTTPTPPPAAQTYEIIFDAASNGELVDPTKGVQHFNENHIIAQSEVPAIRAKAGYTFKGWNNNPVGHKVVARKTFTAIYEVVSSSGGGGGGGGAPGIVPPTKPPVKPPVKPNETSNSVVGLKQDTKFAYIKGYPDNTVKANAPVTRAETASIFARLIKEDMVVGKAYPSKFNDVKAGKWYSDSIGFLEGFNIINGYLDGSFKPNKSITRAEFATMISKFADMNTIAKSDFTDVNNAHWAKAYIDNAVAHGWMNGYPNNTFMPDQAITRAEIVTVINKLIKRDPNRVEIDADKANETKFVDLPKTHWAYYAVIEASTDKK